jgi:acyl-coenzyme A thioesterase PaaI-like protein
MNCQNFRVDTSLTEQIHKLSPYCLAINLRIGNDQQDKRLYHLPFAKHNIGNIFLLRLHGGLLGGFLQSCIQLYLSEQTTQSEPPYLINFAIDYLRGGKAQDSYAQCQILHSGRRISQVMVTMWQEDPEKPIAIARGHLQMANDDQPDII